MVHLITELTIPGERDEGVRFIKIPGPSNVYAIRSAGHSASDTKIILCLQNLREDENRIGLLLSLHLYATQNLQ